MRYFLHIAADEDGSSAGGGGGPDVENRFPERVLRSHGFLALAFGFALGLTLMIFFGLFRLMKAPPLGLEAWIAKVHPNLWFTFLMGFIGGTLISAIYNFLIFRRLNLFGLDRNLD